MPANPATYDCAVIGAGVVGLSVALELQDAGLRCCVIDRQQPGREASWAGAGILPPGSSFSSHPALEELARLSRPLHARLSDRIRERTGLDDGYWRCGGVCLASGESNAAELQSMVDRWAKLGINAERLEAVQIKDLVPYADARLVELADRYPAYRFADEAQVRNPRLLKGLVRLCDAQGVALHFNAPVREYSTDAHGAHVHLDHGETLRADRLVVASGSWSSQLIHRDTLVRVKPMRGQMVLLENPSGRPPLGSHLHCGPNYLVPRRDGRMIVGSTVEDAGFQKSTTADGLAELLRFTRSAGFGDLPIRQTWAGLRPATADGLPLIGPAGRRVFVATGHFRAGLQFAPATATLMRELMQGQPPSMDITPFRVDR